MKKRDIKDRLNDTSNLFSRKERLENTLLSNYKNCITAGRQVYNDLVEFNANGKLDREKSDKVIEGNYTVVEIKRNLDFLKGPKGKKGKK